MSPRSLLFSSDEGRSRPLIQALQELELEVEHCREIFGAIGRLTSRSFDVIVADWDEGPEASFLLQTSRELKLNRAAFALAVASDGVKAAAKEAGADLFLAKPLNPDQIKYALLTCDRFLAHLKVWMARDFPKTAEAQGPCLVSKCPPPSQQQSVRAGMAAPTAQPSPVPRRDLNKTPAPLSLTFATLDRKFYRSFGRATAKPDRSKHRSLRPNNIRSLWAAVLVVIFFSFGYALSQPVQLHNGFAGVKVAYKQVLEAGRSWVDGTGANSARDSAALAAADDQPLNLRFKMVPVRSTPPRISASSSEVLPAQTQSDQELASLGARARIPRSLELWQPGTDAEHNFPARFGASLLGELEPASLSEEFSERLLLEKVQPSYPEQALKAGLQGPVVLQAWIRRDGTIRDLKLVQGSLLLGQAAYNAVKQWRYKPYVRNGEAVEAQTYVTIDFRLPQQSLLSTYPR